MYDPSIGRFTSVDPTGFAAGDANLYRFVGDNPMNATDPSGLAELPPGSPYGMGQPQLWYWDTPDSKTDGTPFSKAWGFGDDEMFYFKRGCVGLCAIRTGSYKNRKDPQRADGVRCFSNLKDALAYQKEMAIKIGVENEVGAKCDPTAVLFAVESKNDISSFCKYLDEDKKQIDPKSLTLDKLEPYDFATAFQKSYDGGEIVYWERMPWGESNNPDLTVHRTKGHTYKSVVYCVTVTDNPLRPHIIIKPKIPFGNPE